jgi:hypothetical protein
MVGKTVQLPTTEYRDTINLLKSTTTTDPHRVEQYVHDVLFEIARAIKQGSARRLAAWAVDSTQALDCSDVGNLLRAGCVAIAKSVLRANRRDFSQVTQFLYRAEREAVAAARDHGTLRLRASA